MDVSSAAQLSFLARHDFAIRRLHSLLGLVPLGVYMVVHLGTNASLLDGASTFQAMVYRIHSLGIVLPVVEWVFIFLPLLFHALLGIWIGMTGRPNSGQYRFLNNRRYTWQRWSGYLAFVFIMVHVFHLHGWFHASLWLDYVARPLGMSQFAPYNAASTLAQAMDGVLWPAFYFAGVMACVYHLANGIWTAGITWGLWISEGAQRRASRVCLVLGIGMALLGAGAWWAAVATDPVEARQVEDRMYRAGVESGMLQANPHKRVHAEPGPGLPQIGAIDSNAATSSTP